MAISNVYCYTRVFTLATLAIHRSCSFVRSLARSLVLSFSVPGE